MMNCDLAEQAREIVERVVALLNEERLGCEIDDPVNAALEAVGDEEAQGRSLKEFHDAIAEFVRQAYRGLMRSVRNLSRDEALAEAILILESGYQSGSIRGYAAACVDAADSERGGIPFVLMSMAEWIKADWRRKRILRVLNRCLPPSDWPMMRQVAAWLANSLGGDGPLPWSHCPPAQLAPCWKDLLKLHMDSAKLLQQVAPLRQANPSGMSVSSPPVPALACDVDR